MGRLFEHPAVLIVLIVIVILLFGSKRLPDLASGIGQSLRIFKKEIRDLSDDDKPADPGSTGTAQQAATGAAQQAATPVVPAAPVAPVAPAAPVPPAAVVVPEAPVIPAPVVPAPPAAPAAHVSATNAEHDPHTARP